MKFFADMFKSRKFTTMITGLVIALLNDKLGWGISPETIEQVLTYLFGYIVTQGTVDVVKGIKGEPKVVKNIISASPAVPVDKK